MYNVGMHVKLGLILDFLFLNEKNSQYQSTLSLIIFNNKHSHTATFLAKDKDETYTGEWRNISFMARFCAGTLKLLNLVLRYVKQLLSRHCLLLTRHARLSIQNY